MEISLSSEVVVCLAPLKMRVLTLIPGQFAVNVKQMIGKAVRRGCALLIIG
jgi:hypothetical protein